MFGGVRVKTARTALAIVSVALLVLLVAAPFFVPMQPADSGQGRDAGAPADCGIDAMDARWMLAPAISSGSTQLIPQIARFAAQLTVGAALALCALRMCLALRAQLTWYFIVYSIVSFIGHPCNAPPARRALQA